MCYKNEKYRLLEEQLAEKTKDVPGFISSYLYTLRSSRTKTNNWRVVNDMLLFFMKNYIIERDSIKSIIPEDIKNIKYTDVINFLSNDMSLKDSTVLTKKAILGSFWKHMKISGVVSSNIVHDISNCTFKNEQQEHIVEIPKEGQLENFLINIQIGNKNDFDCIRNLTIVKLFVGSGIRSEELIGLDIDDLHLDGDVAYITVMGKGKNKVKDTVALSDETVESMEEYLICRETFIEEKRTEDVALFLSNRGTRMSKTAIRNFFDRYSNHEIYPHMLRHLCGTMLYGSTNNIMMVQKQLRHKDIATAAKYYIHVSEEDIHEAVKKLSTASGK